MSDIQFKNINRCVGKDAPQRGEKIREIEDVAIEIIVNETHITKD